MNLIKSYIVYNVSGTVTNPVTLSNIDDALQTASAAIPVDADTFSFHSFIDGVLKLVSWANIKATLKTYFDTLYVSLNNYHFKGLFISEAALVSAYPTANPGDYADVDPGAGTDAIRYIWDEEEGWLPGGSGAGVQSVSGDGVDNTDPTNPVLTFPTPSEIGATTLDEVMTYTLNNQVDDYTLALSDFAVPTFIVVDKAGTADIEIPSNASIPITVGRAVIIKKTGTGGLTFTGAGGVTLVASSGSNTSELNQQVVLLKEATNTWGLYNGIAIDVDALGVVPNTRQIAGIALSADITAAALNYALGQLITSLVATDTDVTNGTTSLADATGYSFSVTANEKYEFEMYIPYVSSASNNGSAWSINGPGTPTYLQFDCEFNTTSTSRRFSLSSTSYDENPGVSATSDTGGINMVKIRGYIQTDTTGTVIARFASEVEGGIGTISVKRNGFGMVKVRRLS